MLKKEGGAVAPPIRISNYASAGVESMRTGPRWRKGLGTDLKIAGARVNFPAGGKKEGRGGKEGEVGRCVWGAVDVRLKLSFRLRGWRSQSSGDSLWAAKPPLFRGVEESRGYEKREGSVGFSLRRLSPSPGCDRPANWPETPRNRSEKRVQFQVVSFEAREKVWFRRGRNFRRSDIFGFSWNFESLFDSWKFLDGLLVPRWIRAAIFFY